MASLRSFNTSTKDAKSFKLRNPQLSSKESERLDTDNFKMEARLRELKLNMKRQKQERGNMYSDGTIWSSGKPGAVTTHGTDLLKKDSIQPPTSNAKAKARKIKVLKDTPLDLPKRTPVSGSFTDRSPPKFKGPACGQCEQKAVALTCMECGENYCTTCFAKFHMKGALKNHRSVPFHINNSSSNTSSLDLSNGMTSSLPPRPSSANRRTTTSTDSGSEQVKTISVKVKDPNEMAGGDFLKGTFSEEESARSFAQALAEWRAGKQKDRLEAGKTLEVKQVESTAISTSTEPEPIKIRFQKDTSISYADKLLIKKHRRSELASPFSPSPCPYVDKVLGKHSPKLEDELFDVQGERLSDDEIELQEEHKRYVGVFSKLKSKDEPRLENALLIMEVTEVPQSEMLDIGSSYSVEEVVEPPGQENPARDDVTFNQSCNYTTATPDTPPESLTPTRTGQSEMKPKDIRVLSAQKKQVARSGNPTRLVPTPSKADRNPPNEQQKVTSDPSRLTSSSPQRHQLTPKSESPAKASQSRTSTQSVEPKSSRHSGLTSAPSCSLVTASHLVKQPLHQYKTGLGDFFLAGVGEANEIENNDERSGHDSAKPLSTLRECSYKGAHSDWRPDSSLATSVEKEPVKMFPSAKPFSPSPPPKSSQQTQRGTTKSRLIKPARPNTHGGTAPQSIHLKHLNEENKSKTLYTRSHGDENRNTLSWTLSEHLKKEAGSGWNHNNNMGSIVNHDADFIPHGLTTEIDRSRSRIEVDGDDMTTYDYAGIDNTETADQETLEQLTWELASQSGRITADGRLTCMSLPDPDDDDDDIYRENSFSQDAELGILEDDGMGSGLSTPFDFFMRGSESSSDSQEEDAEGSEMVRYTAEVQALD